MSATARTLVLFFLLPAACPTPIGATLPASRPGDSVYLLGQLSDCEQIALTVSLFAVDERNVVLLDSARSAPHREQFLKEWAPKNVHRVKPENCSTVLASLFPTAKKVVVCPAEPRAQLLQAACLAGALRAPLLVSSGKDQEKKRLQQRLKTWETREIYAVGNVASFWKNLADVHVYRLKDEQAVRASYLRHAVKRGPMRALVVANPHDTQGGAGMSTLAPWITLQKRGALLLTNEAGENIKSLVADAIQDKELRHADALILAGNQKALPMEKRPNPLPGKDLQIEMEPTTPAGNEPLSFAIGRLFHDDPAIVALMLARPRLWQHEPAAAHQALVVSNPGGGLPFLETFSRTTARELHNAGYQVTTFFNSSANRPDVRAALPRQTIFLWEGHHGTLVRDYEVPDWSEPLRPSLVFLQSCLALAEPKAFPFLDRGAVAVVGASARTYSGSGGALSLSYFDAFLYDKQSLGASLRHAKNFLLCFALLKEKRLGDDAKLTGANLRSAWAFSLWGDPTLHLPLPPRPPNSLEPITHRLRGKTITITLPDISHEKVVSANYRSHILPNARLAGLLTKSDEEDAHPLVPLIFREITFPKAPAGQTPSLSSRLPEHNWVFLYDARRSTGYLLVRPRARDSEQIRFTVEWKAS